LTQRLDLLQETSFRIFASANFFSLAENRTYFACTAAVFRAKSAITNLVLAFTDEWSDIRFGIGGLQLLPEINPQTPTIGQMLSTTIDILNVLPTAAIQRIALGMPEFVVIDNEVSPQLRWHLDIAARLLNLE